VNKKLAMGVLALGVVSSVATSRGERFELVESEDMAMDGGSFGDTALEDCWDDAPVCIEATRDGDAVFLISGELYGPTEELVDALDEPEGVAQWCPEGLPMGDHVVIVQTQDDGLEYSQEFAYACESDLVVTFELEAL
jgi:hypothetical protein